MCTSSGGWPNYPTRVVYEITRDDATQFKYVLSLARFYHDKRTLARALERWLEDRVNDEANHPGAMTYAAALLQAVLEQVDYVALAVQLLEDAQEEPEEE